MWADSLTTEEVDSTLSAADRLHAVTWATPLLSLTKPLLDRLRAGIADRTAYQANPIRPSELSFLFEIRFADSLASAGLTAEYEYHAGVGNTTVDFCVPLGAPWLVELVSLHESEAFKAATWAQGEVFGYALHTDADDPKQSEEGEALKAQERIGNKVFDQKQRPIKFPEPSGSIHLLMVDGRGFGGDGRGDNADWHNIAYGRHGLEDHLIKHWTNPKTSKRAPIKGLLEPDCPLPASRGIRERIHVIGFVCERSFRTGEIGEKAFYCCNPTLFRSEEEARSVISQWPLRRTAGSR